jgi:thiol-disulfide isomerase/thioredoxin
MIFPNNFVTLARRFIEIAWNSRITRGTTKMSPTSVEFRQVFRRLLLSLLLIGAGRATAAEKIWTLRGRVLDQEGHPVAGASVATNWGANGITLEQLRNPPKDGKPHPEYTANEGRMEPWGNAPAQTGPDGRFAIELRSSNECKLLAVDRERKRGALILFDPRHAPLQVECRLVPLVRVFGRLRVGATGKPTRDAGVIVGLLPRADFPMGRSRLGVCSSASSRFEFRLPPGDYRLEAWGHDPPRLELSDPVSIRVTGRRPEFDCGVLDLVPALRLWDRVADAKQAGTWRDLAKRYGEPSPAWHSVDARGVRKFAQPPDFRGKWVLVYFWGPSCGPCIETTLPKLRRFYEAHRSQRDRFELVSICTVDSKWHAMADLDRELKPFVKTIWAGEELPFPIILDNTSQSMENFGVEFLGATVLINPAGQLVQGDESTLVKILERKEG